MLIIELPKELERRLQALVQATGQSASFHAGRAIIDYLGDLEDYQAAEREIEALRAGRSVPVLLSELLDRRDQDQR